MRREGVIPAVLYGRGLDKNLLLSVTLRDLERTIRAADGGNVLINLTIGSKAARTVMIKSLDRDPAKDTPVHLDLIDVRMDRKVRVAVPVHVVGKSEGVALGGILQLNMRNINVECLPADIPAAIDVDITPLRIGASLHVQDLKLPASVVSVDHADQTVVTIAAPAAEEVVKSADEMKAAIAESFKVEGEEGAEGAAPAAGAKAEKEKKEKK
jgi:large subunit ribosomal protein L25